MSKTYSDNKMELENLPDDQMRQLIQRICEMTVDKISCHGDPEQAMQRKIKMIKELSNQKIALETKEANEQHYEVPTEFYKLALGPRLKYSCCLWNEDTTTFQKAEDDMLQLSLDRAQLQDGMDVLDLGCGWGSVSLYVSEKYPNCKVTSVSNSRTQSQYIKEQAKLKGFKNLESIVADANYFNAQKKYDRIISVEMFEHMKNYQILMQKVSSWLKPDGLLFVHILCHTNFPYNFGSKNSDSWMAKYFFASGTMPSSDLLLYFQDDLKILNMWNVNGKHYEKTLNSWLENLDKNKDKAVEALKSAYGQDAEIMLKRWRAFFIYCAECWGFQEGKQWICTHLLFQNRNKSKL